MLKAVGKLPGLVRLLCSWGKQRAGWRSFRRRKRSGLMGKLTCREGLFVGRLLGRLREPCMLCWLALGVLVAIGMLNLAMSGTNTGARNPLSGWIAGLAHHGAEATQ